MFITSSDSTFVNLKDSLFVDAKKESSGRALPPILFRRAVGHRYLKGRIAARRNLNSNSVLRSPWTLLLDNPDHNLRLSRATGSSCRWAIVTLGDSHSMFPRR